MHNYLSVSPPVFFFSVFFFVLRESEHAFPLPPPRPPQTHEDGGARSATNLCDNLRLAFEVIVQRHQRRQIWVELMPGKPEAPVQVLQMLGIAIATPYRGSQRDVQVVDIHVRQFLPLLTPADTPGFIDSHPAQISLRILLQIAGWRPLDQS